MRKGSLMAYLKCRLWQDTVLSNISHCVTNSCKAEGEVSKLINQGDLDRKSSIKLPCIKKAQILSLNAIGKLESMIAVSIKNKKKAFLLHQLLCNKEGKLVNIFVTLIHAAKILDSKYTRAIFSILHHISQVSFQRELYIKISGIEGFRITFFIQQFPDST